MTKNNKITFEIKEEEECEDGEIEFGEYKIEGTWENLFNQYEFDIDDIYSGPEKVYPKREDLFNIFKVRSDEIAICILGMDPYYTDGDANGFAFSVNDSVKIPQSLKNIFNEIQAEFPERNYVFNHGNLQKWVDRSIFLLNCSLSVEEGKPGSHINIWEDFTNDVITKISEDNSYCVFLLLGNFAKSKRKYIKNPKNCIIETSHPSPQSFHKGFQGSGVFKKIEYFLGDPFNWQN